MSETATLPVPTEALAAHERTWEESVQYDLTNLFGQIDQLSKMVLNQPLQKSASLFDALAKAQGEFTTIRKDKTATVKNQAGVILYAYQYADWADVLSMVRPVLSKYGLALTQVLRRKEDKKLYLVTQLRKGSEVHEDDGLYLPENLEPQKLNGLLTYYKRFAGCALIAVQAEEDTDTPPEETKKGDLPTGLGRKAKAETKPDTKSRFDEPNAHGVVISDSEIPFPGDVQKTDIARRRTPEENKKLKKYIEEVGKEPIKSFVVRTAGTANTDSLTGEQWTEVFRILDSAVDSADLKKIVGVL